MARPSMSVKTTSKHMTKAETGARTAVEERLRGRSDRLDPPKYLTAAQKKIFRFIVRELEESGILGNLDVYVLAECSICIDRMQSIERQLNGSEQLDPSLVAIKEKYTKVFFRCCNELCLSPQSRAKLANMNVQAREENPLIKALADDDDT